MINIVIPMAGAGSRFVTAGYEKPKPFIDVAGKPMIIRVLENLACKGSKFYLLVRRKHFETESDTILKIQENFNVDFILVDNDTEGTACTILHARKHINNTMPLLIANSDQLVDIDINHFLEDAFERKLDGSILTFRDEHNDPKWSFAKIDENNHVIEVQEKKVISEYATVGIYLYTRGEYFVNAAIDMITRNDRVNNEFYTCPTYNYLISEGYKIGIFNINYADMHGIGTPTDLNAYLKKLPLNNKVALDVY